MMKIVEMKLGKTYTQCDAVVVAVDYEKRPPIVIPFANKSHFNFFEFPFHRIVNKRCISE